MRAGKGSQVLAHMARLNRRQLHGRTASGALRTLVLRVEHCVMPSVRYPEFTIKPTGRLRLKGIACNDAYLNLIAFGAFEQPVFETDWTGCNALQHHPRLAAGTARALNRGQELWGRGHDTSLHLAGAFSVALCHRKLPRAVGDALIVHPSRSMTLVNIAHFTEKFSPEMRRSDRALTLNNHTLEPSTSP